MSYVGKAEIYAFPNKRDMILNLKYSASFSKGKSTDYLTYDGSPGYSLKSPLSVGRSYLLTSFSPQIVRLSSFRELVFGR
ncbi:hypothetical protein SacN8_08850 [Sulfolobus acidocaldarius N8]|nr:hypothetical protein SacN8_08850 [Sulfolobus acidocaldarius N8]